MSRLEGTQWQGTHSVSEIRYLSEADTSKAWFEYRGKMVEQLTYDIFLPLYPFFLFPSSPSHPTHSPSRFSLSRSVCVRACLRERVSMCVYVRVGGGGVLSVLEGI